MPKLRCCAKCFGDRLIRAQYIAQCDPITQDCDYCGALGVACVFPERLGQWFETLLATYRATDDGLPIAQLMGEEWGMFRNSGLSLSASKELLADVLDDGEIVRKTFSPINHPSAGSLKRWDDLRDELMHRNRWFLSEPMDLGRMKELLNQLIAPQDELNDLEWFRARLQSEGSTHKLEDMGAPPPRSAGHGRANPAGIPYLYLGSTRSTAVSELRPHTGERASVARFTFERSGLKFADLRDPRLLISPLFGDESQIVKLRSDLPLLERLGQELTRPVQPKGAPYEYIPTQYLCEYVKKCGFHGVLYRSSVSGDGGINLALFDPALAAAVGVEQVRVERVNVQISPQ